jgi:predicted nucleotidyltransferase
MITLADLELKKFEKNKQYQKFIKVLNKFVKKKSKAKDISHIFIGGSFVKGALNNFSDLDFYIVNKSNQVFTNKEEKDSIDNVKIDYISIGRESVLPEIKKENKNFYRFFSTCLANTKKVYGDNSFDDIIKLAKKSAESEVLKLTKEEIANILNFLNAQKIESKILFKKNDIIGFHLRLSHLIHACVEYYFKIRQLPKPAWKKISKGIENKKFLFLLENALTEKDDLKKT